MNNQRIKEIMSWYASENPGSQRNIYQLLNHGTLSGTGRLVILPVDQGFEHGPVRSFTPNIDANDPLYHFKLALDSGCNAYAAPLGFLEAGASEFAGQIPLILKVNNSDILYKGGEPCPAITASVRDALRLGCVAIGYTIYPGSALRNDMYEALAELTLEAKEAGLAVVVWSYPRGSEISKAGETAVDVVSYAAHIACSLGAHIIKVKPPSEHIESEDTKKLIEKHNIPIGTLSDRVRYVIKNSFSGRRIVIFSGGPSKSYDDIMTETAGIRDGGGFGSIIGRNSFQRPHDDGLKLLKDVMNTYKNG